MAWDWVSLSVFLLFALASYKFLTRKKARLPPCPPALPILGHIHLLDSLPHRSLAILSKTYGPLMYLRLGSVPTIVASSADVAKELLKTHDHAFASRPKTTAGMLAFYGCSDIALSPYGPQWKQMRKICANELLSSQRLIQFRHVREEEIDSFTRVLLEHSFQKKQVDIRFKVSATVINVISRMFMNKRFLGNDGENSLQGIEYRKIFDDILFLLGVWNIGDFVPYLKWLDLQGYEKRMKKVSKQFDVHLSAILEEHRRRKAQGNAEISDLIDLLLNIIEDSSKLEIEMTENHLKGFMMDMFVGATDTTAATVEWAIAELVKNPSAMKKAKEELDEVVGMDRLVKESDITKLDYLNAVVKETMRLHPAAPLLLPRESIDDCSVLGYRIPAKTRVFVNAWAIGRDPSVWENAERFEAERFLREKRDVDVKGYQYELIPFGSGRRKCLGISLALSIVHLLLARMLHAFDWTLPSPLSPENIDMSEKFTLSLPKAQPLEMIAHARLPLHMYQATM